MFTNVRLSITTLRRLEIKKLPIITILRQCAKCILKPAWFKVKVTL